MKEIADSDLARAMAALAAEHRGVRAPLSVERAVLAEFGAVRRSRIRRNIAYGAIAAMLLAGVFGIRRQPVHEAVVKKQSRPLAVNAAPVHTTAAAIKPPRRRHSVPRPASAAPDPAQQDPFIAIPYTVPLAPEERATIVRLTLSPAAIAAVGLSFPLAEPAGFQQADVLVGEDGRARAIRIVANSSFR